MRNPHGVTKEFEAALCEYTGAPFAVCVNSCTSAILLAVAWHLRRDAPMTATMVSALQHQGGPRIEIPKRTYISVPQSIIHAGGRPTFRDEEWLGAYQLRPLKVWDCARWFTGNMYRKAVCPVYNETRQFEWSGNMLCVSFHASKTLGLEQGGAILHDNQEADAWLRRARFDGRTEGVPPIEDDFREIGYHCYLSPSASAQGILKLHSLPRHNEPLPNDNYPDLSNLAIFR